MVQQSILAVMILIASAAPEQDPGNGSMGQMREVKGNQPSKTVSSPKDDAQSQQPTTNQPPIQANAPTTQDKTDDDAATRSDDNRIRRIRSSREGDPEPRRRAPAGDILKRLRERTDSTPVIPPQRPGVKRVVRTTVSENAVPDNAVRPVDRKLMPDGSRVVDRAGRLTRDGDYLTFTYESRGEGSVEVPLRLLPNRLLEDMERIAEGGSKPVVFVVSGEVTEYRGVNYLLLQKLLMRPDLGNLR